MKVNKVKSMLNSVLTHCEIIACPNQLPKYPMTLMKVKSPLKLRFQFCILYIQESKHRRWLHLLLEIMGKQFTSEFCYYKTDFLIAKNPSYNWKQLILVDNHP